MYPKKNWAVKMTKQKISLHDAVRRENVKVVKALLAQGIDVNGQNVKDESRSALHVAVQKNNAELVKLLLSKGAKVDLKDDKGQTALAHALVFRKLEIADILIEAGGNVNAQDKKGRTALMSASSITQEERKYTTHVKEILARGADVNIKKSDGFSALMMSVFSKNHEIPEEIPKCLIDAGADVNCRGFQGWSALHMAVFNGNIKVVKYLLSRGADVNAKTDFGETALHNAINIGFFDIADYLIEAGIDVNCKENSQDWTALHVLATETNNASLAKKLISRNIDVHAKDNEGVTALSHALIQGALEVADALIEAGGNVNSQDMHGNTAFHLICNSKNRNHIKDGVQLAKELFSRGVDANLPNHAGETALHGAFNNEDLDIAKYLATVGADVNCQDREGSTVLHYAVVGNDIAMVKHLLSCNADKNIKNEDGETALHVAVNEGHFEIADLLTEAGSDVNSKESSHNWTALHLLALTTNNASLVQKLISRGVEVDAKDSHGRTALSLAFVRGALKVADLLIEAGADVDSRDDQGCTGLHLIFDQPTRKYITNGVTLAKALLARGADVNVQNYQGISALHVAISLGELGVAKYLIDAGADVDCQEEKHGNTALHLTADASAVRLLLSRGADVNVKNQDGNTPLHLATLRKKTEIIEELLSRGPDTSVRNKKGKTAYDIALDESNYFSLMKHFAVREENTNFQDATFSRRHLNDSRKTPQFERLKALGDNLDVEEDLKSRAPVHSVEVSKVSFKNRSKSRAKNEVALFDFEQLPNDELLMIFLKSIGWSHAL